MLRFLERATLACGWVHHVPVVPTPGTAPSPPGLRPGAQLLRQVGINYFPLAAR